MQKKAFKAKHIDDCALTETLWVAAFRVLCVSRDSIKMPFSGALQQPLSPSMKARLCKHNSRNMKRSGDSEGEKRRKVLIAFFSVSSGVFLNPVAR